MKKLIALVLALLMAFSASVVAFAADAEAPAEGETTAAAEDDGFNIEDLPFWTIKPGLKVAKIVLKIAKVFLKIALIFNAKGVIEKLQEFIKNLVPEEPNEEPSTAPAAELA